jgi:hypothetical protein
MPETTRCARCDVKYPEHLLQPMYVGSGYEGPYCGICALARSNEIHGTNRKRFDGEIAEEHRRDAIQHRQRTRQVPRG